ncbi:hemojuvelin [Xiphophorus hellerii]|uniref:hemojuvelin n=1 Tax=Xiphophorus hellerii TaxID=8084 RepID=UPI0013B41C31|nr:hemojuvelin-like [Xiphophorus hellerii]
METRLPWKRCIHLTLLLVQLRLPEVGASCRILRCNAEFVAATVHLSGGGGAALSSDSAYCSALRSYSLCTKRTARPCRGDLAYHSAVQGIEDLLIQHRCPRAGPTARPWPLPQGAVSGDACLYERSFVSREGRAPEYRHCSVFGDPHIRTFSDDFHTCAVQGAWPLIDNDYLYVQVTGAPTSHGTHHTVVTKITIIFKSWRQCTDQQLYQAELDDVPAAFADGSQWSGERRGRRVLTVRTDSPGRHAEIRAAYIGTLLVVRQSGRSLGLSVRSPRGVLEAFHPDHDLQLCVWGCPASYRVDALRPQPPLPPSHAAGAAEAHCAALLPTRDVYYHACVFDLTASGDLNSSGAAVGALQDARSMTGSGQGVHLRPVAAAGPAGPQPPLLPLSMLGVLGGAWITCC